MRLIEDQALELTTTARSVLGTDLPLIDAAVTVEQLLAHRSGIGDYLDEDLIADIEEWPFSVRAQDIARTADCLPLLDDQPQKFPPDRNFSYCNGGSVVLALICERVTGTEFAELVQAHVTSRANLASTASLDVGRVPPDAAVGYLADGRPNIDNLPRVGSGDGGSTEPTTGKRYGLGFGLDPTDTRVSLEGCDAGVSFRSIHDQRRDLTTTVVSNSTDGAWSVLRALEATVEP